MKNKFIIVLCCLLLVGGVSFAIGLFLGGETSMWFSKDGVSFETENEVEMVTQTLSNDITNVDINIELTEKVSVIFGDSFSISYDKAKYEVDIEDNTLKVTQIADNAIFNFGINFSKSFEAITVTIPESMVIDKLNLYVDIGVIEIENSNFTDAYVEVDIGDISIENCEFENYLEVVANLGDIDLEDCNIVSSADFKIDIGDLELDLIGNEDDYSINSKIDIGSFKINGIKSDNESIFGNGDKKINIQIDTGNCDLDF